MIDNSRREWMKLMALLGVSITADAMLSVKPVTLTLKERKAACYARQSSLNRGYGYYGFGETW
jgi:hypothetical protein